MTRSNDSIFSIISTLLFLLSAFAMLAYFIQIRDAGGLLAWVFGFAAVISMPGASKSPVAVRTR